MPPDNIVLMRRYYRQRYMATKRWKQLRQDKLEQADYRCELCGTTPDKHKLDVHHLTYKRLGGMPKSTITRIRNRMNEEQVVNGSAQRIVEASTNLDERLAELLGESLTALIGIAKTAQDEVYRKTQNAGALADLYKEIASVTLQVLNAAAEANDIED